MPPDSNPSVEDSFSELPRFVDLSVTSYSVDKDGVVMYHVDVQSSTGTYTIRRRYTDFRTLYMELSKIMVLEQDEVLTSRTSLLSRFTTSGSTLPSLPSAGMWSFLRKHDTKILEKRRAIFQSILEAAASHAMARVSPAFHEFLSVAPESLDRRASYTSLKDYSVPAEHIVYARRKKGRKRNSSEASETSTIHSSSVRAV
ncbi:Aste57867_18095 [Aphanomyces stellatus]|uniref:Aste57867_18095 protein n=1 Tax=Aphanomyces stellatus TaxID=120398 RepID=A0A485LAT0_9STRA|nr:hypothetical protein As57867_018033 [Aphanomyces stellatus]VFT94833.1 Aste57867_18095 [Aphanomyces stellatus]